MIAGFQSHLWRSKRRFVALSGSLPFYPQLSWDSSKSIVEAPPAWRLPPSTMAGSEVFLGGTAVVGHQLAVALTNGVRALARPA